MFYVILIHVLILIRLVGYSAIGNRQRSVIDDRIISDVIKLIVSWFCYCTHMYVLRYMSHSQCRM